MAQTESQYHFKQPDYNHLKDVLKERGNHDLDKFIAKRYDEMDSGKIRISKTIYPPIKPQQS